MKKLLTTMSLVAALMLVLAPAAVAGGRGSGGHSADQLAQAGWTCFNAGPNDWTHCASPGKKSTSAKSTNIKVFTKNGSAFLGSEILLSADVYNGQPCATDNGEPYHDLSGVGTGPYACHHFSTGG
ncbi:MAG: hypothetical protein M3112_08870 [Actinomycetia bacterium]|nr:hypothetical protein [Actinomycetes bacterium]